MGLWTKSFVRRRGSAVPIGAQWDLILLTYHAPEPMRGSNGLQIMDKCHGCQSVRSCKSIRYCFFFFFKVYLLIYNVEQKRERRGSLSILWFIPQTAAAASARVKRRARSLHLGPSHGWQGSTNSGHLLLLPRSIRRELGQQQSSQRDTLIWEAGITSGDITHYATVLIPQPLLLCKVDRVTSTQEYCHEGGMK